MLQITTFLNAKIIIDPSSRVSSAELYAAYVAWMGRLYGCKVGPVSKRRPFTAAVRELCCGLSAAEYGAGKTPRYGVHLIGGEIVRGFRNLRLTTPDDGMHDNIPEGPLRVAAQLVGAAAARHKSDGLSADADTVKDLLLTASRLPWSKAVAIELLDNQSYWFPELETPIALLRM